MSKNEIETTVRNETLIGKFAKEMRAAGFTNVTVTGYRGYYTNIDNHQGSVVTSHLHDPATILPAQSAEFTISPPGPKEDVDAPGKIFLPNNNKGKFFEVFLSADATSQYEKNRKGEGEEEKETNYTP